MRHKPTGRVKVEYEKEIWCAQIRRSVGATSHIGSRATFRGGRGILRCGGNLGFLSGLEADP